MKIKKIGPGVAKICLCKSITGKYYSARGRGCLGYVTPPIHIPLNFLDVTFYQEAAYELLMLW